MRRMADLKQRVAARQRLAGVQSERLVLDREERDLALILEREPKRRVSWPLTPVSWIPVERSFAAWLLAGMRRVRGNAEAREFWRKWRTALGRPAHGA